jgi:hypothetical protein
MTKSHPKSKNGQDIFLIYGWNYKQFWLISFMMVAILDFPELGSSRQTEWRMSCNVWKGISKSIK